MVLLSYVGSTARGHARKTGKDLRWSSLFRSESRLVYGFAWWLLAVLFVTAGCVNASAGSGQQRPAVGRRTALVTPSLSSGAEQLIPAGSTALESAGSSSSTLASSSSASDGHSRVKFEWQRWAGWPAGHFERQAHELKDVASAVATKDNWVSFLVFTAPMARYALNTIFSIRAYGGGSQVMAAVLDGDSLRACLDIGLACYDARREAGDVSQGPLGLPSAHRAAEEVGEPLMRASGSGTSPLQTTETAQNELHHQQQLSLGDQGYETIVWCNVRLSLELLRMGFNVHFSDSDVVYLRHVHASYASVFERFGADAIFMTEDNPKTVIGVNTGAYAVKANERTIRMFEAWYAGYTQLRLRRNQLYLNALRNQAYVTCYSLERCTAVAQDRGLAAVLRHPSQIADGLICPPNYQEFAKGRRQLCNPRALFVHFICMRGHARKTKRMEEYKLWLVDPQGRPIYANKLGRVPKASKSSAANSSSMHSTPTDISSINSGNTLQSGVQASAGVAAGKEDASPSDPMQHRIAGEQQEHSRRLTSSFMDALFGKKHADDSSQVTHAISMMPSMTTGRTTASGAFPASPGPTSREPAAPEEANPPVAYIYGRPHPALPCKVKLAWQDDRMWRDYIRFATEREAHATRGLAMAFALAHGNITRAYDMLLAKGLPLPKDALKQRPLKR